MCYDKEPWKVREITPENKKARGMRGKTREICACATPENKKARGIRGKSRESGASTTPEKKEASGIRGKEQKCERCYPGISIFMI